MNREWVKAVRNAHFAAMFRDIGGLYEENFEFYFRAEVFDALRAEFGPVCEGRYERRPAEIGQFVPTNCYHELPDEFAEEHAESLRILAAGRFEDQLCRTCYGYPWRRSEPVCSGCGGVPAEERIAS